MGLGSRPGHLVVSSEYLTEVDNGQRSSFKTNEIAVLTEVRGLLDTYKNEDCSISITGHSLGGALSTLNAIDLVANGFNVHGPSRSPVPVTAIHFGAPRVGDEQFKKAFHSMAGLSLLRVRNVPDIVPTILPPVIYADVGVELLVDTRKSPYLKEKAGPAQWHNLEGYLHGVAGTHGARDVAGFGLEVDRDLALINKEEDALRDEYPVPAMWWAENNKGMVKNATGHWVLHDHEEDRALDSLDGLKCSTMTIAAIGVDLQRHLYEDFSVVINKVKPAPYGSGNDGASTPSFEDGSGCTVVQ
uniref:Phospholipase A1 n=1 Tax=Aegilops tauschii TaxID=37682 RepID=M8AV55_AEGTA